VIRARILAIVLVGCGAPSAPLEPASREPAPPAPPPPPARTVVFEGMCDASGAVALSRDVLLVADDEDNVLRAYDAERGGAALWSADVSKALGIPLKGKKRPKHPEIDLEAATVLGDRAYWMSSHARNSKGKRKAERFVFFATTMPPANAADAVEVVGQSDRMLDDLLDDERYARCDLAAAAELAPKEPGGLNIEGMTATTGGELLLGFRNPIPDGRALVVPVLNGPRVVTGEDEVARFGDPMQLALDGQGIRSLSWWRGRYLILAGDAGPGGASKLHTWDGRGDAAPVHVDLSELNPEGFFSPEERDDVLVLSDDGSRLVDGVPCKDLEDAARKHFRGVWVNPETRATR
jgi:hypothetical protein